MAEDKIRFDDVIQKAKDIALLLLLLLGIVAGIGVAILLIAGFGFETICLYIFCVIAFKAIWNLAFPSCKY